MYSEKTTIVDVVSLGDDGFSLSITASDLYDAAKSGDVIRRHDISTDAGVHNWAYVGLSEVKLDSNGYTFTFSNGDAFSASADDDYPASDSVSDESGGGSGGGVLVVHDVDGTLDKTWQEIKDAMLVGSVVIDRSSQLATDIVYVGRVFFTSFGGDKYSVYTDGDANQYDTSSASGYPTHD